MTLFRASLLVLAVTVSLAATAVAASPTPGWTPIAGLPAAQEGASLTALENGSALLAGGFPISTCRTSKCQTTPEPALTTSWVFNPETTSWQRVVNMPEGHSHAMAVRLRDGRVLVAGGYSDTASTATSNAAVFDPITSTWRKTEPMSTPRSAATATVLLDGRVLVTGGRVRNSAPALGTASAEIFDPASGRWTPAAGMSTPRAGHAAALLQDGRVLVVGGYDGETPLASAAVYDPAQNSWMTVAPMSAPRFSPAMVAVPDGRVLVVGGDIQATASQGNQQVQTGSITETAEVFDETMLSWHSAQSPPMQGQGSLSGSGGFVMAGGSVLVLESGYGFIQGLVYQPAMDRWSVTPLLSTRDPYGPTAVQLRSGGILVVDGHQAAMYDFASTIAGAGPRENLLQSGDTSLALTAIALLLAAMLGIQRLRARHGTAVGQGVRSSSVS